MKVEVVDGAVEVGGERHDRYEAVGLVGRIGEALMELWPEEAAGWDRDPRREDLRGRIGKKQPRGPR